MPLVEDRARGYVLRIVCRPGVLVSAQRRLDLRREEGAEPVRLGDEVGKRRGGVGEDQRAEPGRLRECVLLRKEAAQKSAPRSG